MGLPKSPVAEAEITSAGVVGDFNRYRHDRLADELDSAVLLIPKETIETLDREGWPVRPGDLGENLTTEGIAYDALAPGRRVQVGPVLLEVTRACDPCTNLHQLPYVGPARGPAFVRTMVGRRGWYAKVLTPGRVRSGDPVAVVPTASDGPR